MVNTYVTWSCQEYPGVKNEQGGHTFRLDWHKVSVNFEVFVRDLDEALVNRRNEIVLSLVVETRDILFALVDGRLHFLGKHFRFNKLTLLPTQHIKTCLIDRRTISVDTGPAGNELL